MLDNRKQALAYFSENICKKDKTLEICKNMYNKAQQKCEVSGYDETMQERGGQHVNKVSGSFPASDEGEGSSKVGVRQPSSFR